MIASVLTTNLAILVLAGFIGFVVISKVPNTLHTPLMSGTNAIHGIVLLGALLLLGLPGLDGLSKALLVIAVAFGTINIIGGFLVTDRMLEMFKAKPKAKADKDDKEEPGDTARDPCCLASEPPQERKPQPRPLHHRLLPLPPGPSRLAGDHRRARQRPRRGHGDRRRRRPS